MNEAFALYVEGVLKGLVDRPKELSVQINDQSKYAVIITITLPSQSVGFIRGKKKRIENALEVLFGAACGAMYHSSKRILIEYNQTQKEEKVEKAPDEK